MTKEQIDVDLDQANSAPETENPDTQVRTRRSGLGYALRKLVVCGLLATSIYVAFYGFPASMREDIRLVISRVTVTVNPGNSDAWVNWGLVYTRAGRSEEIILGLPGAQSLKICTGVGDVA